MKKIRVIWPGKTKKDYFRMAVEDYVQRIQKMISFEVVETREESGSDRRRKSRKDQETKRLLQKRSASALVVLDENGENLTSEALARWLDTMSSDVDFIIGGSHGHSFDSDSKRLSLGKMTLPHELARVVLLEQIFRAVTILKRIPYHK